MPLTALQVMFAAAGALLLPLLLFIVITRSLPRISGVADAK